jgi:outer membrane protein insertion porin family
LSRWIPLAAIVALLVGSALVAGAEDERLKIALLPVKVHSAEDPAYLRAGLSDMLVSRLLQAGVFEVVRVTDPAAATSELEAALAKGREIGADFVLFGSFTRFGQGASLDMQAASTLPGAEGETLREIFVHSGSIGDVIPDLDELVGKVSRFAVDDYDDRAVSDQPDVERSRPSVAKLRQRVEALERDTRDLRRQLDDVNRTLEQVRQGGDS